MKKNYHILPALALFLYFCTPVAFALHTDAIYSGTAVLMDGETGQVLFDKQMNTKVYPASTTKIMTALLVLEKCEADEILTVSADAIAIDEWDSANIGLSAGEEMSVEDALYALMLPSANDAANALAEHVADSQEAFARMMTEKARQLGAVDTNFSNAHGLHDDNHYTTAHDMALITQYAIKNRAFMRYFGAGTHTIAPTNLQPVERKLHNYQYMLLPGSDYYDPVVTGGKVGFTNPAMHTMSTVASKYGRSLICVVMRSGRNEKFHDTQTLLRHGFEDYRPASLPTGFFSGVEIPLVQDNVRTGTVEFFSETDFRFLLRNDLLLEDVYVDYDLPQTFGPDALIPTSAAVRVESEEQSASFLIGTHPVSSRIRSDVEAVPSWLAHPPENTAESSSNLVLGLCVLAVFTAILLVRTVVLIRRRRILRKQRQRRLEKLEQQRKRMKHPAH